MKKKTNFPSYLEKDYWFFLLHDFYPIFSGSTAVCLPNLSYACWPISIKLDKRDQVSKDSKFSKPTAHLPPPGSMGRGTSSGQRLHKLQGSAGALTKLQRRFRARFGRGDAWNRTWKGRWMGQLYL